MKKKLIGTALLLTLLLTGTVGCQEVLQPPPVSSSPVSTEERAASSSPSSSVREEEVSHEVSLPQPGEGLEDIPLKAFDFEPLMKNWRRLSLTILDYSIDSAPTAEEERLTASSLTVTVSAEWKDMTAFLTGLVKQERNNIFLDHLKLEKAYYDTFSCTVTLVNPTIRDDSDLSEDDAQRLVKSRFRAVDRQKLLDAFLGLHASYNLQQASGSFTADSQRRTAIDVLVRFASYKGFVSYRYRINSSEDFTVDSDVHYEQASDDDTDYPFVVSLTLYSDRFIA